MGRGLEGTDYQGQVVPKRVLLERGKCDQKVAKSPELLRAFVCSLCRGWLFQYHFFDHANCNVFHCHISNLSFLCVCKRIFSLVVYAPRYKRIV